MGLVTDTEANRWYNQLSVKANFVSWLKLDCWHIDEAVILSMGRDPEKVPWISILEYVEISRVAKELHRRRLLVERAIEAKTLNEPIVPKAFVVWASKKGLSLPRELSSKSDPINETTEAESSQLTIIEAIKHLFELEVMNRTLEDMNTEVEGEIVWSQQEFTSASKSVVLSNRNRKLVQDFACMAQSNFLDNLTLVDWSYFAEWGAFSVEQRQICTFGEPDEYAEFRQKNERYTWIPKARKKAFEILNLARHDPKSGECPTQSEVANKVVKYFTDEGIKSDKGKPISPDYVRKEAFTKLWWNKVVEDLNFPRNKNRKIVR